MSRVMTYNRVYPKGHPRQGQPTHFVEKIYRSFAVEKFGEVFAMPMLFEDLIKWNPDIPHETLKDFHRSLIEWGCPPGEYPKLEPKHTTIRAGHRWKAGDWFSPRVWGNNINPKTGRSGPYHSNQIAFAPDIKIKKVWDFKIIYTDNPLLYQVLLNGEIIYEVECCQVFLGGFDTIQVIAKNDGLMYDDFLNWFPDNFDGQIICWNDKINY